MIWHQVPLHEQKRGQYEESRKADLSDAGPEHDVAVPCLQSGEADQGFQVDGYHLIAALWALFQEKNEIIILKGHCGL